MTEPQYFTIKQVCERLQVSRMTVHRWIKRGLPVYRQGRIVRIKEADLERFLKEQQD
jgi:excisionase family DNA binding protein